MCQGRGNRGRDGPYAAGGRIARKRDRDTGDNLRDVAAYLRPSRIGGTRPTKNNRTTSSSTV